MNIGNRNSQHSFAQIPDVKMARSNFDRSFAIKDTFDFDYLIPIFLDEVIPGDTYNVTVNAFARLATQIVPIMDNMYVDYFFFFVPNRLVYDKWEQMCGAQANPADTKDYILPQLTTTAGGPEVGTIYDKFGLPTDVANAYTIKNTLPFRAYNLIWNEWFRDQNLQDSVINNVDQGPDALADYVLLKRGKRHDYFTSALPFAQKGDPVSLPLGTTAPIAGLGSTVDNVFNSDGASYRESDLTTTVYPYSRSLSASANTIVMRGTTDGDYPAVFADLSLATAATINEVREAMMLQSLFELDARGGTRYVEILRSHYNVVSPDFRLQRPEFLGGGSSRINSHPVAQTSPTSGSEAQGQLAAFATMATMGKDNIGFTKSFVEHGYIIGLACARADLTYQQGINRLWNRSTRFDFFWPKLQQLGEQEILNKEIYIQGSAADENVFGYQERYGEYRYRPSEIHGEFRSTYATSLDVWHLAEEFSALPVLNASFIQQSTPIDRAIAVTSEPHLLFDCWFQMQCARPMMTYGVPATLGRF